MKPDGQPIPRLARTQFALRHKPGRAARVRSWRAAGPRGKVVTCGIFKVDTGIEIWCGYSAENLVRSQLAREIGAARDVAKAWKQAAIAKGFKEVKGER
jgi:hypothetical protein